MQSMCSLATAVRPEVGAAVSPVDVAALDRFIVPSATSSVADAHPRACVVLDAVVERVGLRDWVGGPVLEAAVTDGSGTVVLAFLGRRAVAGVEPGRRLVAAGTVALQTGRRVVMNPVVWLKATIELGETCDG